ncbi:endonuclease/exonuclease/phosphatase family protein [Aureisphaera galaxeae]|uniref:endonuclease/exonuclease/phosphatase family protein n=1 Tax=Aureisphaera galaxeae TaxID=1538023 RepID=UPI002350DA4A|nr:endonuclease/exonuclease/phosphatase family protein [Aureisphaera galaxeae]MDC8004284.1 endonuclease/exonuclease/phosphatase family protein [Aureisphaera galaxeae]
MNSRYLNVGCWNIEHYGKSTDDNDENEYALAEHIELSGVDILALQELYITDSTNMENRHLRKALDLIEEHTGNSWEYEIFPNKNAGDKSQLCGVAWNTARVTKEETYKIPVKTHVMHEGKRLGLWDRTPHAVKFATEPGKTDLVVIPIHMKSNVGRRHEVILKRKYEAETLIDNIGNVVDKLNDKDIVILGDTNCKSRSEEAIQAFVKGGFEDLNEDDIPTFVRGNEAPFDRIFIPQSEERKAFWYSRQYILRAASPLAHDTYLSDHYLIKTMVKIRSDDNR